MEVMSSMQIRNSNVTKPCGTPERTCTGSDVSLFTIALP
jgi:hypothetical protein